MTRTAYNRFLSLRFVHVKLTLQQNAGTIKSNISVAEDYGSIFPTFLLPVFVLPLKQEWPKKSTFFQNVVFGPWFREAMNINAQCCA